MPEDQKSLINLMNSSGFLFQLRVEDEIKKTVNLHHYSIIASEYHWQNEATGIDGYIDILLENNNIRMVIECKRLRDTNWLFLVPNNHREQSRARLLWTLRQIIEYSPGIKVQLENIVGWDDLAVEPNSPESSICIIRGQSDKDKPLLERLLSSLTLSIESLAAEELQFKQQYSSETRLYVPVIVTNGDVAVCRFDTASIDLASGELPIGKSAVEMVPFVRFRKSLSSKIANETRPANLNQAGMMKERTVFVVKASALPQFLQNWSGYPYKPHAPFPWDAAMKHRSEQ